MSKIIGIDILAGTSSQKPSASMSNRFAAVLIENSIVLESYNTISQKELIKLCREHIPLYLGVDNIFELESNSAKIIHFCSLLPIETKILQVTGAPPEGFEPLNRLAKRYSIPYPTHHANPIQSAEIIGRLTEKGVGFILLPFEEETEIKISRTKAIGPGGWSQQRYSRKMRGEILTTTREVEKQLHDHNIDFDLEVRKTEFGYDNAIFRAYASVVDIKQIVKPFRGELSRIAVYPIRKKRLEFIPAQEGRKQIVYNVGRILDRGLIIGIDPGPNIGIAVLNFNGHILWNDSLKSVARGDIIRKITLLGDPTIIAADVTPPPDFVVKIAKMLNATLTYPERLYSSEEKNHFVNDYTIEYAGKIKGAHKKDALFAALKAYNKYKTIFDRVNKELIEPEDIPLRNKVKQLVILEGMNIQEAITEIKKRQRKPEKLQIKQPEEITLTEKEQELLEKIDALKELTIRQTTHIENLEDMNGEAIEQIEILRRENKNLSKKIQKITKKQAQDLKKEQAIKTRDNELQFLREKVKSLDFELLRVKKIISDLKRMIVMSSSKIVVPMKVIFEFSREGIEKTIERMNIEPFDVVLLVEPSGGGQRTAEMLIEREVKAIVCARDNISNHAMEAFLHANIPVLFQVPIRQIDDIAVTFYDEFQQAIGIWEEQRKKILNEKTEEKLNALIANYKNQRKKELAQIYDLERKTKKEIALPKQPIKRIERKSIDDD